MKGKRKNKQNMETWNTAKRSNTHVITAPEKQERENGAEAIFEEIMMEDVLKLIKDPLE